jgi:hypothetical protein
LKSAQKVEHDGAVFFAGAVEQDQQFPLVFRD